MPSHSSRAGRERYSYDLLRVCSLFSKQIWLCDSWFSDNDVNLAHTRLSKYYAKFDDAPVYYAATILHPHYKHHLEALWKVPDDCNSAQDGPHYSEGWLTNNHRAFLAMRKEYKNAAITVEGSVTRGYLKSYVLACQLRDQLFYSRQWKLLWSRWTWITGVFALVQIFVTFHSYSQQFLVTSANANTIAFIRNYSYYRGLRRNARFGVMPGTPKSSHTEHWATTTITIYIIFRISA